MVGDSERISLYSFEDIYILNVFQPFFDCNEHLLMVAGNQSKEEKISNVRRELMRVEPFIDCKPALDFWETKERRLDVSDIEDEKEVCSRLLSLRDE